MNAKQSLPVRIALFHIMSRNFSGAAKNIFRLVRRLDPVTIDVLLVGQAENELTDRVEAIGLNVSIVPYPTSIDVYDKQLLRLTITRAVKILLGVWKYNISLIHLFKKHDTQVVWADNIRTFVFVYAASKLSGCKIIWNIWSEPKGAIAWVLNRVGLILADCVTLEYERQGEVVFGGLARSRLFRSKLITLYSGASDFETSSPGMKIRDELNLSSTDILVLMASNIAPAKGQLDLIAALQSLVDRFPHVHLLLAGRASELHPVAVAYEARLREYADANDLSRNVHFLGWRSDLSTILEGIDIYASSSYSESFPDAVREAMNTTKPVVVTNVGGTSDLVAGGECGLLFEPGDVQALARHIARLVLDPALRASMGLAGKRIMEERFSTEIYARRFEEMVLALRQAS